VFLRKHAKGKSPFNSMPRGEKEMLQLDGLLWQGCLDINFEVSQASRGVCEADAVHLITSGHFVRHLHLYRAGIAPYADVSAKAHLYEWTT